MANIDFQTGYAMGVLSQGVIETIIHDTEIKSVTYNDNNSYTIIDQEDFSHLLIVNVDSDNKITGVIYDGEPINIRYDKDGVLTNIGEEEFYGLDKISGGGDTPVLISTGREYIDTLYIPNSNTCIECEFEMYHKGTLTDNYDTLFGNFANMQLNLVYNSQSLTNKGLWKFGTYTEFDNTVIDGKCKLITNKNSMTITSDKGKMTVNVSDTSFVGTYSLLLFDNRKYNNLNVNDGSYSWVKLYSFKIYENGELVRNYIPSISNESGHKNEACLYEEITETYYYGQTSSGSLVYVD